MKTTILILIGKFICFIGKITKRGSSLPGKYILKFDKNILSKFKLPKNIIAVTGSSGKGSTSKMIADVLRNSGYSVTHNISGANLEPGILTTILKDIKLNGKLKKDYLVIEVDERYTKLVFPKVKPNYVIITNITRDQPPRQGHYDNVFLEIKKALTNDMHLFLNGDDPYLTKLLEKNTVTFYGLNKNKYSYTKPKFKHLNIGYCPICNNKLKYNYYNFETLGDYYCDNCDFKRPKINYLITNIDYNKSTIEINKKYNLIFNPNYLYQAYNLVSVFALLNNIGLDEKKITKEINKINKMKINKNDYVINKRNIHVLNNKNENSTTFNQSLIYQERFKEQKTIVIGWKEISRRYNFNDLSWLYDIDFEILKNEEIDKIVCVGNNRYDIATRIKLTNIDQDKIVTYENLEDAVNFIKSKTKGSIFAILNFDYVNPFNNLMKNKTID